MSLQTADTIFDDSPPARSGNAWTQTAALLLDAYRDLQSRKLFWITLVLSVLVSGIFGFVGINLEGITIFGKQVRGVPFNSNLISAGDFFKYLFTSLAIPVWLGFLSAILGLIAVGGMFPDTISSGSIDLYLSRPIARLRLFLTKYAFGLMFMALQVLVFCIVSFLVIGLRGGVWEPGIFLAVPLVTLFFSYLYCVCVLIGIVTRSALAAILITSLFWGALFVVHSFDMIVTGFTATADVRVDQQQRLVTANEDLIRKNDALPPERRGNMSAFEFQRDRQKDVLAGLVQSAAEWHWWQRLVWTVKAPLPKTNETVSLMSRWLVSPTALERVQQQERQRREAYRARREAERGPTTGRTPDPVQPLNPEEMEQRMAADLSARDLPWIVGTSLAFEAAVLALGAWVFCRRDY